MYAAHTFINFFVPSGSGQAALTMPVMVPLADLTGASREAAILAFQFGDGLTNMIIPTNAVLIGIVSVARLDYAVWFRWMIRWQVMLFFLGAALLVFAPVRVRLARAAPEPSRSFLPKDRAMPLRPVCLRIPLPP